MAAAAAAAREWSALQQLPESTRDSIQEQLQRAQEAGLESLTVVLVGKTSVGKSSTINTLLNERVCAVSAFQSETARPVEVTRSFAGLQISLIDTPGLIEAGRINRTALSSILHYLVDRTVDVLLYVDRLDAYRVDTVDHLVMRAISSSLGRQVFKRSLLLLSRAQFTPADGSSYSDYCSLRGSSLQQAVRKEGGIPAKTGIPSVALVENSGRCRTNEANEKVLPNGDRMLPALWTSLIDVALSSERPVLVTPSLAQGPDPNSRGKLLIPFVLLLQYFFVVKPLQEAIKRDVEEEKDRRPLWEIKAENFRSSQSGAWVQRRLEELKGSKKGSSDNVSRDDDDDDYDDDF